jgi:predicted glycoside hydrolase/deacetylase ChbG (UPF0249 family)
MSEINSERCLIVNADDFGLTSEINRGIIEAHERGIVTSTSLMVRGSAATAAAELARAHPDLSVGLHFDIAEWRYRDGAWEAIYQVVDARDRNAVENELQRQLATFRDLLGRAPTHLDSHQHVHKSEPACAILLRSSEELRVPLRGCDRSIKYCGEFYGQTAEGQPFPTNISSSHLIETLHRIEPGWTELGCHPGYAGGLDSVYATEREEELRILRRAEIRAALERESIRLCSFQNFLNSRDTREVQLLQKTIAPPVLRTGGAQ